MLNNINLNKSWSFYSEDCESKIKTSIDIPCSVQYALFKSNQKPDYRIGLNEGEYYDLENKSWIFEKSFNLERVNFKNQILVFHGVDTLADIFLNGIMLGKTENMFLNYTYDVTGIIKLGENLIEVKFYKILDELDRILEAESHMPLSAAMDLRRPYLRKMQCSWGWDWGPRILETGIWKEVELQLNNNGRIENTFIRLHNASNNEIRISGDIERVNNNHNVIVKISFEDSQITEKEIIDVDNHFDEIINLNEIKLWYPNGYGDQCVYKVELILKSDEAVEDTKEYEVGFRTVKLIKENDGDGESFIFSVNGIKIFAKGANWIPADAFLNRIKDEDYEFYIKQAKNMNMNMLRVWGGGIYEDSIFYKLCNQYGIMVWQDFMYGCAEYPDHIDDFAVLATLEAQQEIKRLRNYPCVVMYCGNNENNWLMQMYYGRKDDYPFAGNKIYKDILPKLCSELDDTIPYWISSPYSESGDCNAQDSGDMHSWNVFCFWEDISNYEQIEGKFISEFGCQGSSNIKTVREFVTQEERKVFSDTMFSHNKALEGTERIAKYLYTEFGGFSDFEGFILLSQILQGEALKIGIEHFRSRKFRTAGTLYWQLNDNWPCMSFSAIDYNKRFKGLYYYTKRFYDDILVAVKSTNDNIIVSIVNDINYDVDGTLVIKQYSTEGSLLKCIEKDVTVKANDCIEVINCKITDLILSLGEVVMPMYNIGTVLVNKRDKAFTDSVIFCEFKTKDKIYYNYKLLDKYRRVNLSDPKISCEIEGNCVKLWCERPAFGVYIEPREDVQFDDNFIAMEPFKVYTITAEGSFSSVNISDVFSMTIQNN